MSSRGARSTGRNDRFFEVISIGVRRHNLDP
jgi:hypothetical protein